MPLRRDRSTQDQYRPSRPPGAPDQGYRRCERPRRRRSRPIHGTDDDQIEIGFAGGDGRERTDQRREVLARILDATDGQKVSTGPSCQRGPSGRNSCMSTGQRRISNRSRSIPVTSDSRDAVYLDKVRIDVGKRKVHRSTRSLSRRSRLLSLIDRVGASPARRLEISSPNGVATHDTKGCLARMGITLAE